MLTADVPRTVAATIGLARNLGLEADEAQLLHTSNKVTMRLLPVDVVARVAPLDQQNADFELRVAGELAAVGAPVARPDPRVGTRVHVHDGLAVTWWTFYAATQTPSPAQYAAALVALHAGMRRVEVDAPPVAERIGAAQGLVADRHRTPELTDHDRTFLARTLVDFGERVATTGRDQLLHAEPHPGNLLATAGGPRFIDFETCCRGPVEFDVAHAPVEIADHYPGLDQDLLRACRVLALAVSTTWRWDVDDRLPDGPRLGREWLDQLRRDVREDEASRR